MIYLVVFLSSHSGTWTDTDVCGPVQSYRPLAARTTDWGPVPLSPWTEISRLEKTVRKIHSFLKTVLSLGITGNAIH